jgi:group II intron reverse transcriptase/maturase
MSWPRTSGTGARVRCPRAGCIPKPGSRERRPLSIPAVRDRIVQAAVKTVIEPIFEADFEPCSFGFRPRKSAHDALQVLIDQSWRGSRWVAETDIASCFESIPHDRLMAAIEERICDRKLLKLLRALLRAGVMEQGAVRRNVTGTPQGGVVSPLLCNVYLHRLDRVWRTRGWCGVLVRYADDLLVLCKGQAEAECALAALRAVLAELGLELKQAKTLIVHLREGGEGLDFLGFHHRWVRAHGPRVRHVTFLARWPSRAAMQHARDRVRELTAHERLLLPVEQVVRGAEPLPARLGGLFPLRKLGPPLQPDRVPGGRPPRAVCGQPPPTLTRLWPVGSALPLPGPPGLDHARWNRRRAQA